jgi:hypothetical protein
MPDSSPSSTAPGHTGPGRCRVLDSLLGAAVVVLGLALVFILGGCSHSSPVLRGCEQIDQPQAGQCAACTRGGHNWTWFSEGGYWACDPPLVKVNG